MSSPGTPRLRCLCRRQLHRHRRRRPQDPPGRPPLPSGKSRRHCGAHRLLPAGLPAEAAAVTEADIVTGALGRAALPQLVRAFSLDRQRIVSIPQHEKGEDFEACSAADFGVRTRAFLKIQDGCDNWCSYCIIPAARGPVRSKPMPELQSELLTLARNGYREIVLTGINLSNYGREWGCTSPMPS